MQITVQMLDGSITPFKVRSSITIASLKAKFEPWQPMKGRALLHHDVRLENCAILSSIPGIKNGTILRVDKHVSQVKSKSSGKKSVMSGPASSDMDEHVLESIETSGNDEATSSENDRPRFGNKRKRPSRNSATQMEDSIDIDNIADSFRPRTLLPDEMSDDPRNMTDTNLDNIPMTLRIVKKEERKNTAREQAVASEAQTLSPRPHSLNNIVGRPQDTSTGNGTHFPKAGSSCWNLMELDDATFLADINAAAAETVRLPRRSEAQPGEGVLALRCNACGRACGCGEDLLVTSSRVLPGEYRVQGGKAATVNIDRNGYIAANGTSSSQRPESSWTGM